MHDGPTSSWREGLRAGAVIAIPTALVGVSFGVLARPVMGPVAALVMSAIVYAGAAQFGATAVLAAGGGPLSAILAGVLLNARFLAMGIAVAPWLKGGRLRRAAEGQTVVDASWALANRGGGVFDRELLIAATLPQYVGWFAGTAVGAFAGPALGNTEAIGLDAAFPAFFLALLAGELRDRSAWIIAVCGAGLALALLPWAPPGLPVLAAAAAAGLKLRQPSSA